MPVFLYTSLLLMRCEAGVLILPRSPQDFDRLWWLSVLAAVMSFTYSFIGLGLSIAGTAGARPPSSCNT